LAERQHLADWATEALGPLDVLVNNAGLEFGGSFLQMTEEELSSIVAVNLLAVMDLTRVVLPGMLERGRGHIVNIASLAGKVPAPYLAAYAATKHGVVGFTHALRAENGGGAPVGFSAICPGFVTRVGMYARFESVVKAPRIIGTVTPEAVGDGVVRAIQKDLPEVIVNKGPARPLVLLSALAPSLAGRVGRLGPLREYGERMSQVRGRL
jgi:short-subunit dehydrogenase